MFRANILFPIPYSDELVPRGLTEHLGKLLTIQVGSPGKHGQSREQQMLPGGGAELQAVVFFQGHLLRGGGRAELAPKRNLAGNCELRVS